jgi:hypothetical protein
LHGQIQAHQKERFMQDLLTYRNLCLLFGIVFIAVGILGFIPNPLVSETGFFEVNPAHNFVHLASGALLLSGPLLLQSQQGLILKIVAGVYTLVAALGFFVEDGGMLLGMIHINEADKWLHVAIAAALIGSIFVASDA